MADHISSHISSVYNLLSLRSSSLFVMYFSPMPYFLLSHLSSSVLPICHVLLAYALFLIVACLLFRTSHLSCTSRLCLISYCRISPLPYFPFVMYFSPMPYFFLSHLSSSVLPICHVLLAYALFLIVASLFFRTCRIFPSPILSPLSSAYIVASLLFPTCLLCASPILSRLSSSLFVASVFCLNICLLHIFLYCRFSPRPIFIVSLLCLYRRLCPRPICRLLLSPNLFPLPSFYLLPPSSAMFVASLLPLICRSLSSDHAVQSRKAVSDYFISKQISPFCFAEQNSVTSLLSFVCYSH